MREARSIRRRPLADIFPVWPVQLWQNTLVLRPTKSVHLIHVDPEPVTTILATLTSITPTVIIIVCHQLDSQFLKQATKLQDKSKLDEDTLRR